MRAMETVSAAIREAKAYGHQVSISDFQMNVHEDRTVLVNLKTGAVHTIQFRETGNFAEFERAVAELAAAIADFRSPKV